MFLPIQSVKDQRLRLGQPRLGWQYQLESLCLGRYVLSLADKSRFCERACFLSVTADKKQAVV